MAASCDELNKGKVVPNGKSVPLTPPHTSSPVTSLAEEVIPSPPVVSKTLSALWEKPRLTQAVKELMEELDLAPSGASLEPSLTRLSGAMTNAVYRVQYPDLPSHNGFILRVYGSNADLIISRVREMLWLERLSANGIGSRLLGIFDNGRIESYLPSTTLTAADIRDPDTSATIATEIRRLHNLIAQYPHGKGDHQVEEHKLEWRRCMEMWLPEIQKAIEDAHISGEVAEDRLQRSHIDDIPGYVDRFIHLAHDRPSLIVVSHNDLQYGNLLRLNADASITMVDFEYAGYNPRAYDIANHFIEWTADYHGSGPSHILNMDNYPSLAERRTFLLSYTEGDETETDALEEEVAFWGAASHLVWGLWGLLQTGRDDVDFDYFGYGCGRLDHFRQTIDNYTVEDSA